MENWVEWLMSLGTVVVGGIVWAVRLEGRINVHDTLLRERKDQQDERWEEVKARLERIESKLDGAKR